jgi:hypothetical protein
MMAVMTAPLNEPAPVYQSSRDVAPDSDFEPGELRHLVIGRRGRLLDPRRTPVEVTALDLDRGYFEVEILAFEDARARWLAPLEWVRRYQFTPGADAAADVVAAGARLVAALDRPLSVPADPAARPAALRRLAAERTRARRWLDHAGRTGIDLARLVAARSGDPASATLLTDYLGERDLADLDAEFAAVYVSNPHSGEVTKGHAIVLAELGLCPFTGTVVRDAALFDGRWSKHRRAEHLLSRMGFVQALFATSPTGAPAAQPSVFRAFNATTPLPPPRPASFVSASFSLDVAMAHFRAGPPDSAAVLYRQPLPLDRLLMTFVETPAMSRHYREAEAVLIGDPTNHAF